MKILVTGAKGNLGSHILKNATCEKIAVGRDEFAELDKYMDASVDVVIHAAYDLKNRITEMPDKLIESNLLSTTQLLRCAKQYKIPRIVFISSCAVYGEARETCEVSNCTPLTVNGLTKYLNEKIIQEYCESNHIKFDILRVFNTFGGEDQFSVLHHLENAMQNKSTFRLNNKGRGQRDFIHVDDVSKVVLKLLQVDNPYPILNIGTGKTTSIANLFEVAKKNSPQIRVEESCLPEVEYSCAQNEKMLSLIDFDFIDVMDFVRERWKV